MRCQQSSSMLMYFVQLSVQTFVVTRQVGSADEGVRHAVHTHLGGQPNDETDSEPCVCNQQRLSAHKHNIKTISRVHHTRQRKSVTSKSLLDCTRLHRRRTTALRRTNVVSSIIVMLTTDSAEFMVNRNAKMSTHRACSVSSQTSNLHHRRLQAN